MPLLNEKELVNAIRYQADQLIPLPLNEASIDVEIIHQDDKNKKILALIVASSKKIVEKVQRVAELNGLIPDSIENELSAASRFVGEIFKITDSQTGFIVANISLGSTSLYFFDPKLKLIIFNHNFNTGINLFLREVMVNLNLSKQKASEVLRSFDPQQQTSFQIDSIIAPAVKEISSEIKKFISAITQKYQVNINNIYFINEIINFPALTKAVATNTSISASLLNPTNLIKKSNLIDSFQNSLPLFVTTIGGNLR
jgi:type IV pilus assembly protein PilM